MRYLAGMASGAGLVAATALIVGASQPSPKVLDVERINIREKDGTLRLVIAGRDRFPGSFQHGAEVKRPDRDSFAGLLLLNDEGTENGGLIWKGTTDADGKVDAGASLTFDRYGNDQTLQLLQTDGGTNDMSAIIFSDRPAKALDFAKSALINNAKTQDDARRLMAEAGVGGAPRVFLGRSGSRNSVLMLQDEKGRPRLTFSVTSAGEATISFLDEKGQVTKTIKPDD